MVDKKIILEWFARLPKGYANYPYSKEEIKVLQEVLDDNEIDADANDINNASEPGQEEQPEEPQEPTQRRFRGKTADFMESPEALSSFIISRYTDGVVKIQGFDKLHKTIRNLSDQRLQSVTKMIYENTNRELINGTFKMGDNERLLLKLILNSLKIQDSNSFNLFLAIIYDGKINAYKNPTEFQVNFTVAEQIRVATHTNFNSQTISLGVITPELKNKLETLKGIYKLIKNRDLDSSYPVTEVNSVLAELQNPNVQQEIQNLLTNARSSNIESMKALAQQIQTTLDSTSIQELAASFINDVDSVLRLKFSDINHIITVTNRMVYVKRVGQIYKKLKPETNIPNSIMNFSNGNLNLSSTVFNDLILEIKIDTKKILESVDSESLIKEWFARLPKGFAEYPYTEEELEVLQEVLSESDDIRKKVVDTIKSLDPTEDKTKDLLSRIYRLLNTETYQNKFSDAIKNAASDDNVINNDRVIKDVSKILLNMPVSLDDIQLLIEELENTGTVINISELQKPTNTLDSIFKSNVKNAALAAFKALANYGSGRNQAGPGEYALSILSKDINMSSGKGDIVIGNDLVELKFSAGFRELRSGEKVSTGGGRLGAGFNTSQKDQLEILEKYKDQIPEVYNGIMNKSGKSETFTQFIRNFNKHYKGNEYDDILYNIVFEITSINFGETYADEIAKAAVTRDPNKAMEQYAVSNFDWYQKTTNFDGLLFIALHSGKLSYLGNSNDLKTALSNGVFTIGAGLIGTNSGARREAPTQLTLR